LAAIGWEGAITVIMELIAWIVLGAIAGWLAGLIVGGHGLGTIGTIVLGIVGALVGGFVFQLLLGGDAGAGGGEINLMSIVVATIGAVIVVAIAGMVMGRRSRA
jgi:uncharacterized membrane protein YeaQ/YmgE (transglycosylase-associated protein family)